jgi:hypothetical protein
MKRAGLVRQMTWLAMVAGVLTGWPGQPAVGSAAAAMYQWTTPDGTIGLTDDPGRIPDQYRATAKPYQNPETRPSVKQPPAGATAPEASSSVATNAPAAADVDQNGHNRAWWRERIQSLTNERADLTSQRDALNQKYNQLHYFGRETIEERTLQQTLRKQLDDLTQGIDDINHQLTSGLPDEARQAGAPPGWLRN